MEVTAWKNGPLGTSGLIFGIRVGVENAHEFFEKRWTEVIIEVGRSAATCRLSATFWSSCPELRNALFEEWMRAQNLIPWKPQNPNRI